MQTILCYGDSNTWGYDPQTRERFPAAVRWTGVLQHDLGDGFRVIEEGLNGRTTVWDDPMELGRNGRTYLRPCLDSHRPLDLVTIMLGTNDLKRRFNLSPSDIAQSASVLAQMAMSSGSGPHGAAPVVLLMAPPPVGPLSDLAGMFEGAEAKSREFHHWYRVFAGTSGAPTSTRPLCLSPAPLMAFTGTRVRMRSSDAPWLTPCARCSAASHKHIVDGAICTT